MLVCSDGQLFQAGDSASVDLSFAELTSILPCCLMVFDTITNGQQTGHTKHQARRTCWLAHSFWKALKVLRCRGLVNKC